MENLTTRLKKREYRRAIRLSRELCLDDSFIPSNGPPSPRRSRSVLDNRGSGNSNIIDLVDSAINGRSRGETII